MIKAKDWLRRFEIDDQSESYGHHSFHDQDSVSISTETSAICTRRRLADEMAFVPFEHCCRA